jgi:hypothetical protein
VRTLSHKQAQDPNGKFFLQLRGKLLDERVGGEDSHKASWEPEIVIDKEAKTDPRLCLLTACEWEVYIC